MLYGWIFRQLGAARLRLQGHCINAAGDGIPWKTPLGINQDHFNQSQTQLAILVALM